MATSEELIRAPGIRNQPERPRGREAKQADLGTIYRGRPPIDPASNRQHDSDAFKQQFPGPLGPLAFVSDHPWIRDPNSTWPSHSHHIRPRLVEADVTSSDSIRAAMTSSQPQLELWHPSTTRGCSDGQCELRRRLLQRVALTHRQDASVDTKHPTGSTMMRHAKRVRTELAKRMTHLELWCSLDKVPVS